MILIWNHKTIGWGWVAFNNILGEGGGTFKIFDQVKSIQKNWLLIIHSSPKQWEKSYSISIIYKKNSQKTSTVEKNGAQI